jgi:serine phosphatase RsbU (regulator of sigma subunit)
MVPPRATPAGAEERGDRASRAVTPPHGPGDPLELLLQHLHGLVQVEAAAFLTVDTQRTRIEPAARWFASARVQEALEPTLSCPYDAELPGLVETAVERGRPLFLPRIEDWEAAPQLRSHFEARAGTAPPDVWEIFNRSSVIACPVRTPIGQTLGVLIVASSNQQHPLTKDDVRLVEVLTDLAALALERSDLLSAEASRTRTEMLLKRATEGMSGTLETDGVYARAVEHAIAVTGADHGVLSRLLPGTSRLSAVATSQPWSKSRIDAGVLREVTSSRKPQLSAAAMHVPVMLGPRLFGVLSVAREGGPAFDREALDLLQQLARIAAAGIANAIDFERERRIVRALTRGFVAESLPSIDGYDVGLLYEPADSQPTGGDLYGVWVLPTGQVALLIGDVAGKGVETAALSAMARFFIEARSWDCSSPGSVLGQANTMLGSRLPSDTFVTAFLALLTDEGIRYANAGHLSPLVLRGSGELGEAGGRGLPLGIRETTTYEDRRIAFAPGDLMFAFTDGLVEARKGGQLYGAERLEDALVENNSLVPDLDQLVRVVFDDVRGWAGRLNDDAVALAVRRRTR